MASQRYKPNVSAVLLRICCADCPAKEKGLGAICSKSLLCKCGKQESNLHDR